MVVVAVWVGRLLAATFRCCRPLRKHWRGGWQELAPSAAGAEPWEEEEEVAAVRREVAWAVV